MYSISNSSERESSHSGEYLSEQDRAQAQEQLAKHAKSFRLASLFLPTENADHAAVVYQLCRLIDDAVDEAPSKEVAELELNRLRAELAGEQPPRPALSAFLAVSSKIDLDLFAVEDLMQGVYSDIDSVRVADDHELGVYCYRVAGAVGLMMCSVLGVSNKEAYAFAVDLGLGMQITNICRDVLEDAGLDRIYLPQSRLTKHQINPEQLLDGEVDELKVSAVINELLDVAEQCYERSMYGMFAIPWRARLGILIARRVYRAIGLRLKRKHNSNPMHGRTIVPMWEKLCHVCLGCIDFLSPVTWRAKTKNIPDSPFYSDWRELRN